MATAPATWVVGYDEMARQCALADSAGAPSMAIRLTLSLLVLATIRSLPALASVPAAARTEQPRINAPKAVVSRAWPYDPLYGAHNCDAGICTYALGQVHLLVNFGSGGRVTDIQMYQYPNPGRPRYWTMLLSFLPSGARRQSCRAFRQTAGLSGPARACLYRWNGRRILVVQWLRENPLGRGGWVDLGISYRWLQRY